VGGRTPPKFTPLNGSALVFTGVRQYGRVGLQGLLRALRRRTT
jgi:hypothetical protein